MSYDDVKEYRLPMVGGEHVEVIGPKPDDFTGLGHLNGDVLVRYPDGELGCVKSRDISASETSFVASVNERLTAVELPKPNIELWWATPSHFIDGNLSPRDAEAAGRFDEVLAAVSALEDSTYA